MRRLKYDTITARKGWIGMFIEMTVERNMEFYSRPGQREPLDLACAPQMFP
jgi:hypothetical protein